MEEGEARVRAGSASGGGGGSRPLPCPCPPLPPKKDDRDQACATVLPRGQCAGPPGAVVASCVHDVLGAGRFPAMGELAEEEERRQRGRTCSVGEGEARAGSAAGGSGGGGGGGPPHCPRPLPPSDKDDRNVVKGEDDCDEARATGDSAWGHLARSSRCAFMTSLVSGASPPWGSWWRRRSAIDAAVHGQWRRGRRGRGWAVLTLPRVCPHRPHHNLYDNDEYFGEGRQSTLFMWRLPQQGNVENFDNILDSFSIPRRRRDIPSLPSWNPLHGGWLL